MKPVLAFTQGVHHPSARLRIEAYADHLAVRGWQLQLHPFSADMGKSLPTATRWWQRMGRRWQRLGKTRRAVAALKQISDRQPIIISRELPVRRQPFLRAANPIILDIDDAMYLGCGRGRLLELCGRAQVVVCGNETINTALKPFSRRCVLIPTVVDVAQYPVRTNYRLAAPLRVGWLGSSMSANETLLPWLKEMRAVRREVPFELVVISDELPHPLKGDSGLRFLKWSPAMEHSLADHLDIGVMPLQDNPQQAAKCGAKLLQYMAAGLPVITTPLGVNRDIVRDGVTGFWAEEVSDWSWALRRLARDEALRQALGQAGRVRVTEHYSVGRWADLWATILNEISR